MGSPQRQRAPVIPLPLLQLLAPAMTRLLARCRVNVILGKQRASQRRRPWSNMIPMHRIAPGSKGQSRCRRIPLRQLKALRTGPTPDRLDCSEGRALHAAAVYLPAPVETRRSGTATPGSDLPHWRRTSSVRESHRPAEAPASPETPCLSAAISRDGSGRLHHGAARAAPRTFRSCSDNPGCE
jgi:hypothetical protein